MALSPQPSSSSPWRKHAWTISSRSAGAGVDSTRPETTSMATISQAAHLAQEVVLLRQLAQPRLELLAALAGVVDVAALQQVDGGQGGAAADGVAAEGAGVAAAGPVHDLLAGDDGPQGHAAGDPLGQADDVRGHAPVLDGEHLAGAAHA